MLNIHAFGMKFVVCVCFFCFDLHRKTCFIFYASYNKCDPHLLLYYVARFGIVCCNTERNCLERTERQTIINNSKKKKPNEHTRAIQNLRFCFEGEKRATRKVWHGMAWHVPNGSVAQCSHDHNNAVMGSIGLATLSCVALTRVFRLATMPRLMNQICISAFASADILLSETWHVCLFAVFPKQVRQSRSTNGRTLMNQVSLVREQQCSAALFFGVALHDAHKVAPICLHVWPPKCGFAVTDSWFTLFKPHTLRVTCTRGVSARTLGL